MGTAAVLLVASMLIMSGKTVTPEYKGCYSTTFVNQYAFYYKLNQTMNIEQGFAACDNRLTTYIGLQANESAHNVVYCGNDLTEVSPKLDNWKCFTCHENATLNCGGIHSMSVYMLRESTPLAVLLKTYRGVELLEDNSTTIKVNDQDYDQFQIVDYIYTEDLTLFFVGDEVKRSVYDNIRMDFTKPKPIWLLSVWSYAFALDFVTHHIFFEGGSGKLRRTDTEGSPASDVFELDFAPEHITIDPFNRSLTFTMYPYDSVYIWLIDDQRLIVHNLKHLTIKKIMELSMDIQERYLYAIVEFIDTSSTYLVRLDYGISEIRLVFSGPQLKDAIALEVFRDHAVWLTKKRFTKPVLYRCKLTPRCHLEDLTSYSSDELHHFTIYHPEKQTPGKKRLCANMTCSHGCELFSPFTARCTCPTGMEIGHDSSTCNERPTTTTTSKTQVSTSTLIS